MNTLGKRVSGLVSTQWLAERLANPSTDFRLLDGSWHMPFKKRNPNNEFNAKHIPTAQFFGIDECCDKSTTMDHMLPNPEQFAKYVGNLGVSNSTHVVLYDNNEDFGIFSAQRVWWTFRVFGHDLVSVLDGGLPKWIREGRETSDKVDKIEFQTFVPKFNPSLVKNFHDIEENIPKKSFTVVDARAAGRFDGTSPEPRPEIESGHIPGSVNIPFTNLLDTNSKTLKSENELQKCFEKAGVNLSTDLVGSCGTGISACLVALCAYQLGKDDMAVYDGSWTEWYQKSTPEQRIKDDNNSEKT